jgi:hypothetical protein
MRALHLEREITGPLSRAVPIRRSEVISHQPVWA